MNLAHVLADSAAARPVRTAVLFEGARLSYDELDRRAAVAAAALREEGVREGDRVALVLPNTPDYLSAFFGILRLGAIAVPLNVLLAPPEVEHRLDAAKPRAVVDRPLPVEGFSESTIVERAPHDPAVLLFTSGTTGGPKGAVLTHGSIAAAAGFCADALSFSADDVVLGVSPFPHVLGQQVVVSAFRVGAAVCVIQRFEASSALATMTDTRTTVMLGVPTMCIALCEAAWTARALPPLRLAHIGGAAVPVDVTRRFEETFGAPVHEGYGLTEMSGLATTFATGRPRKAGSVGRPSSDTDLRIAAPDERGVGEVQLRGPSVVLGYWNDPAASAAAIDAEGWLSTGDLGYLDDDGDLFLVDRKQEMIIRGGYNVYPREVEEALYEHPGVLEVAVLGVPHETLGEEIVAIVVPRPGAVLEPDELQAWARARVAAYKYPRHVLLTDTLPKSPTGKTLKRAIDVARLVDASADPGAEASDSMLP